MWSVFSSGQTTVTCWFCNEGTQLAASAAAGSDSRLDWHCTKCDNQNTLDGNGNQVDSRAEMYQESPLPRRQRVGGVAREQVFCTTCQRNQELVCQILSAYLPDEEDPEYTQRVRHAEDYARSLRRRYPLVCRACQAKVDDRLQRQAQWMCRRELASALQRSERARKHAPNMQPQPTLRRKGLVVTWLGCALVGVGCQVAVWAWYASLFFLRPPAYAAGVCAALALLTYMWRVLNPLWLYIACNPGMRAAGLPLYKRRIARLALVRLAAALLHLFSVVSPRLWPAVALYDVALCFFAGKSLCVRGSLRSRPSNQAATTPGTAPMDCELPEITAMDEQNALASLKSLSFGSSETNRDQDDSFFGTEFASGIDTRWGRRPSGVRRSAKPRLNDAGDSSGDDVTVNTDIMADLSSMSMGLGPRRNPARSAGAERMDVDAQPVRRPAAAAAEPRPFEPFRFKREINTGLEMKMSSFSLDDADDGSYQGLFASSAMDTRLLGVSRRVISVGVITYGAVLGTWIFGSAIPLWCFWPVRAILIVAMAIAAAAASVSQPALLRRRVAAACLLAALVGVPTLITLREDSSAPSWPLALLRWPLAKSALSNTIWQMLLHRFRGPTTAAGPYPHAWAWSEPIDCAAELASLLVLALTSSS